jgi:hypothetical protein
MAVPNIFGTATSAIPLSQLDTNFATPVTIGNTAVQLGNTVTSFGNVTLTNVTISSGNVTITGANVSGTANVSTLVVTGNQSFVGTGNRITGDFTNATQSNRVAFQTSTANSATAITAIPNGTATQSSINLFDNSNPTNAGSLNLLSNASEKSVRAQISGTGTYLPLTFYTGGSERIRIVGGTGSDVGFVGIGTSSPAYKLNTYASTTSLSIQQVIQNDNAVAGTAALGFNVSFVSSEGSNTKGGIGFQRNAAYGGGFMAFYNNNSGAAGDFTTADEKMRIDNSGNVLVTSAAGLGYGTGAGGTVTQATSKSTAVTLNKPTGQITMNNAALGAGVAVEFSVNNSVVAVNDCINLSGIWGFSPNYRIELKGVVAGGFAVRVTNITAGSLSEALAINFAIIKGATA